MTRFNGVISTPMAPFDQDGKLSVEKCDEFSAWQKRSGISGMFCLGTWGGFALLDSDERRKLTVAWCKAGQKHDLRIFIQVAAFSPREAMDLARLAADNGADAIASVIPVYYSGAKFFSLDDYRRYFGELAKATSLPLYLYNNPRTTGVLLSPKEFVTLAGDGLDGVKDGSTDPGWVLDAQNGLKDKGLQADIIPGNTSAMIFAPAFGLTACMSGAAVCFPRLSADTWAAVCAKDMAYGGILHRKLFAARHRLGTYGHQASASYALLRLQKAGLGYSRLPWSSVNEASMDKLVAELRGMGVPDVA